MEYTKIDFGNLNNERMRKKADELMKIGEKIDTEYENRKDELNAQERKLQIQLREISEIRSMLREEHRDKKEELIKKNQETHEFLLVKSLWEKFQSVKKKISEKFDISEKNLELVSEGKKLDWVKIKAQYKNFFLIFDLDDNVTEFQVVVSGTMHAIRTSSLALEENPKAFQNLLTLAENYSAMRKDAHEKWAKELIHDLKGGEVEMVSTDYTDGLVAETRGEFFACVRGTPEILVEFGKPKLYFSKEICDFYKTRKGAERFAKG